MSKTTNEQNEGLNTLEAQGAEIAKQFKKMDSRDRRNVTKDLPQYLELGKLLSQLRAESDSGRIASNRLKDCGVHAIDKRRRSEALWYADNEKSVDDFKAKSRKGFTSITALQKAWKDAQVNESETQEPETEITEGDNEGLAEPTGSDANATPVQVAESVIALCNKHGIDLTEVTELLMEHVSVTEGEQDSIEDECPFDPPFSIENVQVTGPKDAKAFANMFANNGPM